MTENVFFPVLLDTANIQNYFNEKHEKSVPDNAFDDVTMTSTDAAVFKPFISIMQEYTPASSNVILLNVGNPQ